VNRAIELMGKSGPIGAETRDSGIHSRQSINKSEYGYAFYSLFTNATTIPLIAFPIVSDILSQKEGNVAMDESVP
jgi:hypothetical protein